MDKHSFRNIQKKLKLTNQGVSNIMGVRLQTVKNWAEGVWEIPLMAEKFLRFLLPNENDYKPGFNAGYSRGYKAGQMKGFSDGYDAALGD